MNDDVPEVAPTGLLMLVLEAQPLRDLSDWPPVGVLIETLTGALHGHDALTEADVNRLRRWARGWTALRPELRAWYAARAATDGLLSFVLLAMLDGRMVSDVHRGRVAAAWLDEHGSSAWFDLCPEVNR